MGRYDSRGVYLLSILNMFGVFMKTFSNKGFLMGLLRVALFFLFLEMMLRLGGAVFVCVQDIKNRDNYCLPVAQE